MTRSLHGALKKGALGVVFDELERYVRRYGSDDIDATNFWDGFYAIAGPVDALAFADDPDPHIRERYLTCLRSPMSASSP